MRNNFHLDLSRRGMAFRSWFGVCCLVLPLSAMTPHVLSARPAPPASSARHDGSAHRSTNHIVVNGTETFQWSEGDHRVSVRTEGKLQLTDDWTGIASLSRGTEVRFEEEDGRTERRLDVEAGADGRPVYTWKVDGKERPFDAEGRKWLQGMLLQYVRGTGYDADRRVAWFLAHQGPDGLLAEISQIPGDYGKGIYFQKLFAHRDLGPGVVERALRQAGKEIGSDYYLRQTLVAAAKSQRLSEPAALAYVEASRGIESDYEQRQALAELAAQTALSPRGLAALLQAAKGIDSDYELAEALSQIGGDRLGDPEARRAYFAAVDTLGSAYERHRALSAAVKGGKLSPDALTSAIEAAQGISSDYERASLLVEIANAYALTGAARDAYAKAAGAIRSEYERKRAEQALRDGR